MSPRARNALLALVAAQACHSVEEYAGRLWEVLPPAAFVSGLFSRDLRAGFVAANAALVGFGLLCGAAAAARLPVSTGLAWFWVVLECANAASHTIWTLAARAYRPGIVTAPLLLAGALVLARELRRGAPERLRRGAA
jgi:hypothetical protein